MPLRRTYLIAAAVVATVVAAGPAAAKPDAGKTHEMVFFSTQLTPVAEAEQVRNVMLRNFRAHRVQFVPAASDRVFEDRIFAEQQANRGTVDALGGAPRQLRHAARAELARCRSTTWPGSSRGPGSRGAS